MQTQHPAYETIDEYIRLFPGEVQTRLEEIRSLVHAIAPDAEERISYRMPAFYLNGNLIYFAAYANHVGFYPTASGISHFIGELKGYTSSKGAIQFPHDRPLPTSLIRRIVEFRTDENRQRINRTRSR